MARKTTWKPTPKQQAVLSCVGLHWEQDPQEWQWKYGDQLASLLNQPDPSPDGRYYMTSERMINHVGLLEDVKNDHLLWEAYQARPDEWVRRQRSAVIEFDRKILTPIRKRLEGMPYQSTLYRAPALGYSIHAKTGLVVFTPQGESVLKLLPLSSEVGAMRGMNKANLDLITPDVIYVILMKKRAYRTIPDEDRLLYYLDSWVGHIRDGKIRRAIYRTFEEKSPILVGSRVTQLMLGI
jgi:hypothetical protein